MISGVGELDIEKDTPKKVDARAKDMPYPDCPFLLLDVRDQDAYDQCHIVGGERARIPQQPSVNWGHIFSFLCHILAGLIFSPKVGHHQGAECSQHSSSTPIFPGKGEGVELVLIPYSVGFQVC